VVGAYFKWRRPFDLLLSLAIVALCQVGPKWGLSLFQWPSVEDARKTFVDLFQAAASLLGFVLASVTFLASHVRQPEFDILRRSKSYPELIALFGSALWRLAMLMTASAIAGHLRPNGVNGAERVVLALAAYALLSLVGLVWATLRIIGVSTVRGARNDG